MSWAFAGGNLLDLARAAQVFGVRKRERQARVERLLSIACDKVFLLFALQIETG